MRALLCRVLRAAGYRVLEAANGGEALLLAEQREGGLELLLCELVLPRSSGRLVARRIAALAPGLRVLFLSGSELDAAALPDAEGGNALLRKPLTPTELLAAVAAQLRAPR